MDRVSPKRNLRELVWACDGLLEIGGTLCFLLQKNDTIISTYDINNFSLIESRLEGGRAQLELACKRGEFRSSKFF